MSTSFTTLLWLLLPELVLLLVGLLILGLSNVHSLRERKRWPPYLALAGVAGALVATFSISPGGTPPTPSTLPVLARDSFALGVKVIALAATGMVILSSDVYVRARSQNQGEFYALLLLSALSLCLLGGATDLILIFLACEFLNITLYILTGYLRDDRRSTEAAIKYFISGATMSAVMLYGMSWFYGLTGTTDLSGVAEALGGAESALRVVLLPALLFVTAGLAFKIGAVPFHQWLPDACEGAPTPVAALLSVTPTIAGFALLVRFLAMLGMTNGGSLTALPPNLQGLVLDWQALVVALAALTMTVGNLAALWQHSIKRLLAYSGICQAGYMLVGLATTSSHGTTAALFYLTAYVLANLGAFAAVIAFSSQTGSDFIEDYAGLSRRAPALALALAACLLSLVGIPTTAGFVGKLLLLSAAMEKGLFWLAVAGVLNSVVSVSSYWKIVHAVYLAAARSEAPLRIPPTLAVVLGATVTGTFVIGVLPGPLLALIEAAVRTLIGG